MKYMAAVLLLVAAMSAQNASSTNKGGHLDIPAISREAKGSVVSIVMSDKKGHPIVQGSGFFISKDGRILTNYHVIKSGNSAIIKLPDGTSFPVEGVLASDKHRDVAIIKARGIAFQSLPLGDSGRLQIGEEVVAIGSPLSLESTVSNGIISGLRTDEKEGGKFLQITAPISPGSSGGPLFNMAGEVVGITTSHIVGGENLNFAIPINDIKPMLLAGLSKAQALPDESEPVTADQTTDNPHVPLIYDGIKDTLYHFHRGNLHITATCIVGAYAQGSGEITDNNCFLMGAVGHATSELGGDSKIYFIAGDALHFSWYEDGPVHMTPRRVERLKIVSME